MEKISKSDAFFGGFNLTHVKIDFKKIRNLSPGKNPSRPPTPFEDSEIGLLRGVALKTKGFKEAKIDLPLYYSSKDGYGVYVLDNSIENALKEAASKGQTKSNTLSPITISNAKIGDDAALHISGMIHPENHSLLSEEVPFTVNGDALDVNTPIKPKAGRLGPLRVTQANMSLGVGDDGKMEFAGMMAFSLTGFGNGQVEARGMDVLGSVNLDTKIFSDASIKVGYVDRELSITGKLEVAKGQLPGNQVERYYSQVRK